MISTLAFHIFSSKSRITQKQHILFSQLTRGEKTNVCEKNQYAGNKTEKNVCFLDLRFWFCFKLLYVLADF